MSLTVAQAERVDFKVRRSPSRASDEPVYPKHKRSLLNSFRFAFEGLIYAFRTQPNLRIHLIAGSAAIFAGLLIKLSYFELALICLVVMFVIVLEIVNTALELSLDLLNGKKYHPLVKIAKDVIAAGVLLASVNAVIVGAIIFLPYL